MQQITWTETNIAPWVHLDAQSGEYRLCVTKGNSPTFFWYVALRNSEVAKGHATNLNAAKAKAIAFVEAH